MGSIVCDVFCVFVTFPYGVLGQVWSLLVSNPNLCHLPYLYFLESLRKYNPCKSDLNSQCAFRITD